ncbi:MAG: dethiobiotin synthase [Myxococcales bacterium]|nr:dethiobiotin synthase [Myxococcales bacterium]USN51371.1 MAG: dethiobiotin synthase [Myxococcales bacterium]
MNHTRFVTGTGTDVGKTMVSALLTLKFGANYFKPIQSGSPTDSDLIRSLIGSERVFDEDYLLTSPLSPNQAAQAEGRRIEISRISVSEKINKGRLIVEGAGGVLSPINESETIVDLIAFLKLTTILVARSELGTLTHTLQSVNALEDRRIPISCIILFGKPNSLNQMDLQNRTCISTFHYSDIKNLSWELI